MSRLSSTSRVYYHIVDKYRSLSRQHSGVSPSPQSALGSPQSAEVGVGRRPRRRSLFYTRLYTDYSIGFSLLYAYGTRTHGFLRYGFTLFKHGLRISLHEIHT